MSDVEESVDFDFFESSPSSSQDKKIAADISQHDTLVSQHSENHNTKEDGSKRVPSPTLSESSSNGSQYSSDESGSESKNSNIQQSKDSRSRSSHSSLNSSSSSICKGRNSSRSDSSCSRSYSHSGSSSHESEYENRKDKGKASSVKDKNKRKKNVPVSKGRILGQRIEDDASSSTFSDGDDDKSEGNDKDSDTMNKFKKRAWDEKEDMRLKKTKPQPARTRPMTAKDRSPHLLLRESDRDGLSDSDITDVSPIESPRIQDNFKATKPPLVGVVGDGASVKVQYRAMPIREEDLMQSTSDLAMPGSGLDLDILMQAVGELEKQKRVEENTRRVMFAPMTLKINEKANYTFNKGTTHDIEKENQRLLKEIVKQVNGGGHRKHNVRQVQPCKVTPSAVNRDKEMRRIEAENLAILKRLQKVKATHGISKATQIKSYESTKLHGIPIASLHPLPKGRFGDHSECQSQLEGSVSSLGSRTRSLTSLHSLASSVHSSRPSSATKRMGTRPKWSDRW